MIELSLVDLLVGGLVVYGMNENVAQNDKDIVIYRQRNMEGLNQDTVDAIRLITFSDNTDPVGSFKYKIHRYPGDVDIFEPVKICCTKDKAIATISTELQRIAQKVKNHKTVYWGDFKAGMDLAFKPQESETFEHYRSRINISKTELDNLRDDFPESTRSLYIIRWTADDVIKGFKILKSKKKLTLQEAITHDSVVKLDLWAPINGNYTEVTNLFLFIWVEADGTEHVLNAKLADRLESLNKDIAKYSNIDHYNPLKLAKRMWIKALLLNNSRITKILAPLFASGAAQLNQIIGESETIRAMFQKLSNPPMNQLLTQIHNFKRRINDVYDFPFNEKSLYDLIDDTVSSTDLNKINNNLQILEETLKKIVNKISDDFLKTHCGASPQHVECISN